MFFDEFREQLGIQERIRVFATALFAEKAPYRLRAIVNATLFPPKNSLVKATTSSGS